VTKANGGITYRQKMAIYKGVAEPILLYGCEVYGRDLKRKVVQRKLNSVQRRILLNVIYGYSTVSHDATRVLAGVIPVDLQIEERLQVKDDVEEGLEKEEDKARRREEALDAWNRRWNESEKGRETYFPVLMYEKDYGRICTLGTMSRSSCQVTGISERS